MGRSKTRRKLDALKRREKAWFVRTEAGINYQYNSHVAAKWAHYSRYKRENNLTATFKEFYDQLQDEELKDTIIVLNLKENGHTANIR